MSIHDNGPAGQPAEGPGSGENAEATPPTIEHPDAALLALDQRCLDFRDKWRAAENDDESDALQMKMYEVEKQIAATPAQTLLGAALKVAHLDDAMETGASDWDMDTFKDAKEALGRLTDSPLIRLEQEYFRLLAREAEIAARGEYPDADKDSDANVEKWQEVWEAIRTMLAYTPAGMMAKLRALRHWQTQVADNDDEWWDSCLASLANMGGIPTPVPSAPPIADEADAKLFAIAAKCDRLHEIWRKSCEAYSDAEGAMFDKKRRDEPVSDAERAKVEEAKERNDVDQAAYNSIEKRLLNMPAHTPQGLATKVRIFRRYHANTSGVASFVDEFVAIAERASTRDNPDTAPTKTAWLAMFEEYRERVRAESAVVVANDGDTDVERRATEEATAATQRTERQIAEAEADGLLGLAVKLAVLWNSSIADHGGNNIELTRSALDYLAQQTGIDPYVTYDRDCNPIREFAEIGGAS